MKFQIDFNNDVDNSNFLINSLGAVSEPSDADEYPPSEALTVDVQSFKQLKEILKIVNTEFKDDYSAVISFDPATIYLDNNV